MNIPRFSRRSVLEFIPVHPPRSILLVTAGLFVAVPIEGFAGKTSTGKNILSSVTKYYPTGKQIVTDVDPAEVQAFQLHFQFDSAEAALDASFSLGGVDGRVPYTIQVVKDGLGGIQISGQATAVGTFNDEDLDIFQIRLNLTGSNAGSLTGEGHLAASFGGGSNKPLDQIKNTTFGTGTDFIMKMDGTRISAAEIGSISRTVTTGVSPLKWDDGIYNNGFKGGDGMWDTTTARFDNVPRGGAGEPLTNVAWNNAANQYDVAHFGGKSGAVTLGVPISAGGLVFEVSDYTLSGSTLTLDRPIATLPIVQTAPVIDTDDNDATINSALAGTKGFEKLGTGTLTLGGANTYTGTTTIKAGTVKLDRTVGGTLSNTTPVTLAGNSAFALLTNEPHVAQTLGALTFAEGDGTVQFLNNTNGTNYLTFASLTRAPGATGTFSFVGGSVVNAITFTAPPPTGFINQGLFQDNFYAAYNSGGYVMALIYGVTADTAPTNVIQSDKHVNLTTTPAAQNSISLRTLRLEGAANFTLNAGQTLTLSNGGIIRANGFTSMLSGGTGITAGAAELVISTDNAFDTLTIATPILASSTGGLTKSGPGTLTLSDTNAYTGTTTVNQGRLVVNGTNGTSPINLATEATLGGTGTVATIAGSGTVSPGGNAALPGLGAGVLTATSLDPSQATDFRFDIGMTGAVYDPTKNDLLRLTGATPFLASLCGTSRVLFDFQMLSLTNGMTFVGGFFTDGAADYSSMLQGAAYVFTLNGAPVPAPNNFGVVFNKMVSTTIDLGPGVGMIPGYIGQFSVVAPKVLTVSDGAWATGANWFTPGVPATTDNAVIQATGTIDINATSLAGSTQIQDISFTGSANTTLTNSSTAANMVLNLNGGRGTGVPLIHTNGNVLYTIVGTNTAPTPRTLRLQLLTGGDIKVEGTGQLDISAVIQESGGSFGLTKTGTGTLILSGANTFTGAIGMNGGILRTASVANSGVSSPLGAGTAMTFNGGTLEFTGVSGTTNRPITLTGDGTVSIPSISNTLTLAGAISGSGSLIKSGNGTLVLTGVNSYTGPTLILTRSLMASSAGGSALPGNVTLGSNSGDNAFLRMGAANQLELTSVLSFNQGNSAGKFELRGFNQTVAGLSSDADDIASIIQNEENGNPTLATLTINNTSDYDFTGIIRLSAPGTGAQLNLVKTGSGTQVIRNSPLSIDYFGTATINAGKLTFNFSGPTGSLGTNTTITVNPGGQLGLDGTWNMDRVVSGSGSVVKEGAGTVTLSAMNTFTGGLNIMAGTLAAAGGGDQTGRLGQGAVTVNAGTTLRSDIGDSFGFFTGAPSVINVTGGTVTTGGSGNFRTTLPSLNLTGGTVTSAGGNTGDSSGVFSLNAGATVTTNASATTSTISAPSVGLQGAIVFTVADGSAPTDLAVSSVLRNVTYGGAAGGVTKAGTGTMTLSGANTYTGATTVNAGTLVLSGSLPNASTIAVNGATLSVTGTIGAGSTTSINLNGAVPGTLTGTGTVNGAVTVNFISTVRPAGDTGAGTLTVGAVTFAAPTILPSRVEILSTGSVLARLNVTTVGGLVANSANSARIDVSGSTLALGQQILIDYTGAIGGAGFGGFFLNSLPPRTTAALVNNAGNTSIDLNVTAVDSPVWSGALGSVWSTAVLGPPKNWVLASNNTITTDFLTNDSVLFNDAATTTAVAINGANVTAALVRFNNTTKNYTVTGTDGIAGFLPFTKDGTGTVTLSNTNSFTGPMNLNAGTLSVPTIANAGTPSALGAGANVTFNGGTLQFTGTSGSTDRSITLAGAGKISFPSGNNNTLTFGGNVTGAGALTLDGASTVGLQNVLTLSGSNGGFTGGVIANIGGIKITSSTGLGSGVKTITLNNGTLGNSNLQLDGSGGDITLPNTFTYVVSNQGNNGSLVNLAGNNTIAGSINNTAGGGGLLITSLGGHLTISANYTASTSGRKFFVNGPSNGTVTGIIANGSTPNLILQKAGSGTWTLSGANTYSGATTIGNGVLSVGSLNSVTGGAATSNLGHPTTAATGTIALGGSVNFLASPTTTGTLRYTGAGETTDRIIDLAGTTGGGVIDQSGTGVLKFTSSFTASGAGAKTLTLQGSTSGSGKISGVIVDNSPANPTSLVKAGTGAWALAGTNTYTGATTVNGGTLYFNVSETLTSLTIADGATAVLGAAPFGAESGEPGAFGEDPGGAATAPVSDLDSIDSLLTGQGGGASVPEPGSLSLLLLGALSLLRLGRKGSRG